MTLALLAAAWLAGLGAGLLLEAPAVPFLLLLSACLPVGALLKLSHRPMLPALLAALVLLGLLHAGNFHTQPLPLQGNAGREITLTGRIIDDPAVLDRHTRFTLAVASIETRGLPTPTVGKVLAYAATPRSQTADRRSGHFRYGRMIRLQGAFEQPEAVEEFDYPAYLAGQGISGILWVREAELLPVQRTPWRVTAMGWIFDVRASLAASLDQGLVHPHSALAKALLLGRKEGLPPSVTDDFRLTGAAHLLAISGLHVGILLVLALAVGGLAAGRRRGVYLLVPLAAIWLYALLSGLPPSVVRAAVMGTVYLAALALGRPRSILPALALTAGVMAGVDPRVLGQVSFQLSFAAMAGIVLALPYQARVAEGMDEHIQDASTWWRQ